LATNAIALDLPERLGKYQILGEIGQGGMAIVYKGRDDVLDKIVAIKVLRPELTEGEQYLERFKREAKLAAGLEHPNIISVFDFGFEAGFYYFVMNYIRGVSVYELICRHGRLPAGDGIRVSMDLLSALAYAHQRDLIHRDLKPENLMISDEGTTILTDFGIARPVFGSKLTRVSQRVGTPIYMSPEQVKGAALDTRSDLYSAGIAVFEMLTGKLPFQGSDDIDTGRLHVTRRPPRPSAINPAIGPAVEATILRSLEKQREDRFQKAEDMSTALMEACRSDGVQVPEAVDVPTIPERIKPIVLPPPGEAGTLPTAAPTVDEYLGNMQRAQSRSNARGLVVSATMVVLAILVFLVYRTGVSLVTVTTIPPGAEVEEGSTVWPGTTPHVMRRASVGLHDLRFVLPGYVTRQKSIEVRAGHLTNVTVVLERK